MSHPEIKSAFQTELDNRLKKAQLSFRTLKSILASPGGNNHFVQQEIKIIKAQIKRIQSAIKRAS